MAQREPKRTTTDGLGRQNYLWILKLALKLGGGGAAAVAPQRGRPLCGSSGQTQNFYLAQTSLVYGTTGSITKLCRLAGSGWRPQFPFSLHLDFMDVLTNNCNSIFMTVLVVVISRQNLSEIITEAKHAII